MTVRGVAARAMQAVRDRMDPDAAKVRLAAEELAQKRAIQRMLDIRWLMGDERGRRIVYQLLNSCGYQGSTLTEHGRPSAVLEGQRLVAIRLAQELCPQDPDAWLLMLREAMNASKT